MARALDWTPSGAPEGALASAMRFYVLDHLCHTPLDPWKELYCRCEQEDLVVGESSFVCDGCGKGVGIASWESPRKLVLSHANCGDIVPGILRLVVSSRFRAVYREAGLTGLTEFLVIDHVRVQRQPDALVPDLLATWPNYAYTTIDEAASGLLRKRPAECDRCRGSMLWKLDRIVLNEETWDGSDVFVCTGLPGAVIVSELFVEAVDRAALTNFTFVGLDDYSFDFRR